MPTDWHVFTRSNPSSIDKYNWLFIMEHLNPEVLQLEEENLKLKAELNELTRVVDELRAELKHRDSILEIAPNFAAFRFVVDSDYYQRKSPHLRAVAYTSPNFQEISGVADPSNPEDWFAQMHPDDIDRILKLQGEAPESGYFDAVFRSFHCIKNEWCWLHVTSNFVNETDGTPKYINGIVTDITEYKRNEIKLLTHQKTLRSLNDQVMLAEERERRRVAEVLHDDVGQELSVALFKMNQMREKRIENETALDEVAALIEQAISYTRILTKELCPPALCQMGLASGLEWLAKQSKNKYGFESTIEINNDLSMLEEDISTVMFRITAELLNNIAKHSSASNTEIKIAVHQSEICLSVKDNGIGFEYSPDLLHQSDGFGLFMISERVRSLNGHIDIDSTPGKGTQVSISIPLPT